MYWSRPNWRLSHRISQKTDTERLEDLEADNNLLKQQVKAASDQNEFLEDCIAEMAEIVYA